MPLNIREVIEMAKPKILQPSNNEVPSGTVAYFAMNTAPEGWLKCDGSIISRTTYANLFSKIGTIYGTGDGSTTFKLPDLRGEFIRSLDNGRGIDTNRALGSNQLDTIISHSHSLYWSTGGTSYSDPAQASWSAATAISGTVLGSSSLSGETRPRNIAMLACIKI